MKLPDFQRGFGAGYPVLVSNDVPRMTAYFRDALGFETRHAETEYAILQRGPAEVHIGLSSKFYDSRTPGQGSVYFWVDDADARHAELAAKGARDLSAVADQPWGMRDFTCLDPDGNKLGFGHALAQPVP